MADKLLYAVFEPSNYDGLETSDKNIFNVLYILSDIVEIKIYSSTAEHNRVDKTKYLADRGKIVGTFREESSVLNITFTFETNEIPTFNYAYIPHFDRYYFVEDVTFVRKNLWEVSLSIDVLMTYRSEIKKQTAFVLRNEHTYNRDIPDNSLPLVDGYDYIAIQGHKTFIDRELLVSDMYDHKINCVLVGVINLSTDKPK